MKVCRGMIVSVEFSDHVEGASSSIRFITYGRVHSVKRKEIVIDSWAYADKARKKFDGNQTRVTIIRSCIYRMVRLVEGQVLFDDKERTNGRAVVK